MIVSYVVLRAQLRDAVEEANVSTDPMLKRAVALMAMQSKSQRQISREVQEQSMDVDLGVEGEADARDGDDMLMKNISKAFTVE